MKSASGLWCVSSFVVLCVPHVSGARRVSPTEFIDEPLQQVPHLANASRRGIRLKPSKVTIDAESKEAVVESALEIDPNWKDISEGVPPQASPDVKTNDEAVLWIPPQGTQGLCNISWWSGGLQGLWIPYEAEVHAMIKEYNRANYEYQWQDTKQRFQSIPRSFSRAMAIHSPAVQFSFFAANRDKCCKGLLLCSDLSKEVGATHIRSSQGREAGATHIGSSQRREDERAIEKRLDISLLGALRAVEKRSRKLTVYPMEPLKQYRYRTAVDVALQFAQTHISPDVAKLKEVKLCDLAKTGDIVFVVRQKQFVRRKEFVRVRKSMNEFFFGKILSIRQEWSMETGFVCHYDLIEVYAQGRAMKTKVSGPTETSHVYAMINHQGVKM